MNIVCVKWGNKYSAEYVNRLYTMVKRYFTLPFTFYCYTDDPTDIREEVQIIPIDEDLEIWWNKVALFKKGRFKGECLYFDLDTVIQRNVDMLAGYSGGFYGVYTAWDLVISDGSPRISHHRWRYPFNSSILRWKAEDWIHIWDKFNGDRDWYMVEYEGGGDDKFLIHNIPGIKTFEGINIYSRLYGATHEDTMMKKQRELMYGKEITFYYPDYHICLFNGKTKPRHYEGFERYWNA